MWILYALGAAFFSGLTSVLCKAGVDDVDSEVSTTIRTIVILFIYFIVTFYNEILGSIENLNIKKIKKMFASMHHQNRRTHLVILLTIYKMIDCIKVCTAVIDIIIVSHKNMQQRLLS